MARRHAAAMLGGVPSFLIEHRHAAAECGIVFASFKGHSSELRRRTTLASCRFGGHAIWWCVRAEDEAQALALLPSFVARRAVAVRVGDVAIP
jgi:hypothetical protein